MLPSERVRGAGEAIISFGVNTQISLGVMAESEILTRDPVSRDQGERGGELHFASRKDQKSFVLWQFIERDVSAGMKMML